MTNTTQVGPNQAITPGPNQIDIPTQGGPRPKRRFATIQVMAAEGLPVQAACRMLEVSESGYYAALIAAPSERSVRHVWLTDVIRQVHLDSRGTYGSRRIHAELTLGHGLAVGYEQVTLLMRRAGIQGLSGRPKWKRAPKLATALDLVDRQFARDRRDMLWVTDIERHEAPCNRAVVKDHRLGSVVAGS